MVRIEPEQVSKGARQANAEPPSAAAYHRGIHRHAGVSKLGAGEETAKGLHGMEAAAYPFLGKLDA